MSVETGIDRVVLPIFMVMTARVVACSDCCQTVCLLLWELRQDGCFACLRNACIEIARHVTPV